MRQQYGSAGKPYEGKIIDLLPLSPEEQESFLVNPAIIKNTAAYEFLLKQIFNITSVQGLLPYISKKTFLYLERHIYFCNYWQRITNTSNVFDTFGINKTNMCLLIKENPNLAIFVPPTMLSCDWLPALDDAVKYAKFQLSSKQTFEAKKTFGREFSHFLFRQKKCTLKELHYLFQKVPELGVNIYSTYLNNSYATMNGTSMATPYVTGLVAAMLSKNSAYTTEQIKAILKDSANSTAVTSSVNIGRFISMSKVMASLGVQNDTYIGNDPTTGSGSTGSGTTGSGGTSTGITNPVYAPQLSLSATKLDTNKYRIVANAYETGGTIVSYSFLNGSALLYSGTTNTYDLAIAQNTTITVTAKDARGESVTKTINLAYTAPTTPVYTPQLTVSAVNMGNNIYRIYASAYETGGTIVSYTFTNGNTVLYSGNVNNYLLSIAKNTTITVSAKDARGVSVSKTVDLVYTAPTTPVYAPQLSVSAISLGNNTYRVYASAFEINGKIVSYAFANGNTLLYSGTLSYYQITVNQNTTLTVSAKDARGVSVSKTVALAYTAPKPNVAPTVNLTNRVVGNMFNQLTLSATDSDGKIARVDVYVNGVKKYYMQPNAKVVNASLLLSKGSYTIRVVVTDDKGATVEKSLTLSK